MGRTHRTKRRGTPFASGIGRRFIGALTAMALVLTGAVVTAPAAYAAGTTAGTIDGLVFQDFSSTGYNTTGTAAAGVPRNRPIGGIDVTAFDAQGDIVGTATSATDGTYTLPVTGAYSDFIRVEFSGWPVEYQPAFAAQAPAPTEPFTGTNDTSVQFVDLANLPTDGVDFGLIIPDQVIQRDAPLVTAIQYAGDPTGRTEAAVVAQPWSATGSAPGSLAARSTLASFGQVGSIWGASYVRTQDVQIVSAAYKRMSGLGPLGLTGVYRIPNVLAPDGSINPRPANEDVNWFKAEDLTILNGPDAGQKINFGTVETNAQRGLGAAQDPALDQDAFAKSGRVGIGGIATTLGGEALLITNLFDHQIYAVDVQSAGDASYIPTDAYHINTGPGEDGIVGVGQQIFGITTHSGRLYVAVTDTGDDSNGNAVPGQTAQAAVMHAYVHSADLNQLLANPDNPVWRMELDIDLGYLKGSNMNTWPVAPNTGGGHLDDRYPYLKGWNSWTDTWSWTATTPGGADTVGLPSGYGKSAPNQSPVAGPVQAYPQPLVSGLAFDIDGYLNIGIMDRNQLQSGNMNWSADGSHVGPVGNRTPQNTAYWQAVANGDILVAAPAAESNPAPGCHTGEPFVLECNGVVGTRTTQFGGNNQGPGGHEFFQDQQNQGNSRIHNENSLGSVATYPGVDEVAITAIDPTTQIYRAGNMWFNQDTGQATRGYDQFTGTNANNTAEFQKGGGLGAVSLLGVAPPVEIGNLVWLDADLNGRQDPDEPAINGAIVELYAVDANGARGALIGTRTTATIDGQPGTYYFRSDDSDIQEGSNPNPFIPNQSYVLKFRPGTGPVDLVGPNAGHEGFAGLDWSDLQLTEQLVRVAPTATNGGTTALNDSNAATVAGDAHGEYGIGVAGPGENDHSYDAGYYATNTYEITKDVVFPDGDTNLIPDDQTFTVDVESAANFRGEDRLSAAGQDPHGRDPQVTELTFTLTDGQTVTTTQELPIGYELTFSETDTTGAVQEFTPNTGDPTEGRLVITPRGGADLRANLDVVNAYGGFSVEKSVDPPGAVPDTTEFSVTYKVGDNGTEVTETVTPGSGFSVTGIPVGTIVYVKEDTPLPAIPGVEWGDPTWNVDGSDQDPDGDGWVSVEITDTDALVEFALTNNATLLGTLQVTKSVTGDQEAIDAVGPIDFTVNWRTTNLTPEESGSFTVSSDGTPAPVPALEFPEGTTIELTEDAPTNLPPGVSWDGAQWTAAPNITVSDDGSTATVTIIAGATSLTTAELENTFLNDLGSFEVSKELTGDFDLTDPEFANVTIPIEYSYTDPTSGDLVEGTLDLNEGNGFQATGPTLPAGTDVTVAEGTPTGAPPNVSWGDVSWTIGGVSTDPPITFTIADDTTVALVVTNEVTELFGTFQVCKDFSGDFDPDAPELANVVITVTWTAPDQTTGTIELTQAGQWCATPMTDAGEPIAFPLGTTITVAETGITGGAPDLEFGSVSWNPADPADPTQGLVTISSETDPALATVTNGTTQLFGTFSIAKQVDGDFDLTSPEMAGAVFTVTATWPGGSTDLVLNQANGWMTGLGQNLPTGTVVTLSEATPSGTGPSVDWGADAAWAGTGITDNGDGTASITIGDGTNPDLTVTNTATELRGTFEASKLVTGDFDLTDPQLENAVFTVAWSASDGQTGSFDLVGPTWAGGPVDGSDAPITFPLGTTVTLSEPTISGTGPDVSWGDVSWSPGDQGDGTAEITISDDQTAAQVELTNEVTQLTGTFGVAKQLSGDFDLTDPEIQGAEFAVTASWPAAPGLAAGSVDLVLDASNGFALPAGVQLPTGTTVTLSEVSVSGTGPSVQWGDASWSGDGLTVNTDGTASFVIGDNTAPEFTVTNEVTELTGTFHVAKDVVGDFDLTDPEMQDAVFTVTASWPAAPGLDAGAVDLVLDASNGWTAPAGVQLPTGTTVTLSEVMITGTGPSVQWDGATWSGPGLTVNDDGTASFVIGDDTDPEFDLTNEATELLGMFSITKLISGGVVVPTDTTFTITYTYDGLATPGTLEVGPGETVTSPAIPVGTQVTISELTPTGDLPEGASWGTPEFVLADGTTSPVSVMIVIAEADQTVEVQLTNPVIPPLPVTGSDVSWALIPLGLLLLLLGVGFWLLARRRTVV